MGDHFIHNFVTGAPSRGGKHRAARNRTKSPTKKHFGLKSGQEPDYLDIVNIDKLLSLTITPKIAPFQLCLNPSNQDRDQLLDDLQFWSIDKKMTVVSRRDESIITVSFDNILDYSVALKVANASISSQDAIYEFKNCPILLCKNILTKETQFVETSFGPEQVEQGKIKFCRPLDLEPCLKRISEYNESYSEALLDNLERRREGLAQIRSLQNHVNRKDALASRRIIMENPVF